MFLYPIKMLVTKLTEYPVFTSIIHARYCLFALSRDWKLLCFTVAVLIYIIIYIFLRDLVPVSVF